MPWYYRPAPHHGQHSTNWIPGNYVHGYNPNVRPSQVFPQATDLGYASWPDNHGSSTWPRVFVKKRCAPHHQPRHHVCFRRWVGLDAYTLLHRGVVGQETRLRIWCYHGRLGTIWSNFTHCVAMATGQLWVPYHVARLRPCVRSPEFSRPVLLQATSPSFANLSIPGVRLVLLDVLRLSHPTVWKPNPRPRVFPSRNLPTYVCSLAWGFEH